MNLVWIGQYTPPEADLLPLYETIIHWSPDINDLATLDLCLNRLLAPLARALVRKNREMLLVVARDWYRVHKAATPSVLAQCLGKAITTQDVPQIIQWLTDHNLSTETRANYALDLEQFARKPGIARDALLALVNDADVGGAAVWAIAGALKTESLRLLLELQESSPHELVRKAAVGAAKKVESYSRKTLKANPSKVHSFI